MLRLAGMLEGSLRKSTRDADAAFKSIPTDVLIWGVALALEAVQLLPLRAVSTAWREVVSNEEIWLTKLTTLTLQYPSLGQLDQGAGESAFNWFWRSSRALGSRDVLARHHLRGEYPYLKLYGMVENYTFTPFEAL